MTINILYLPLYFKMVPGNFLHLQCDYQFSTILIAYMVIQWCLWQLNSLHPTFFRHLLFRYCCCKRAVAQRLGNHYIYDHTFDEEANKSSDSYLSAHHLQLSKAERKKIKLQRMRDEECIVCLLPLGIKAKNQFLKTPCRHKFHKKCLLHWIDNVKR